MELHLSFMQVKIIQVLSVQWDDSPSLVLSPLQKAPHPTPCFSLFRALDPPNPFPSHTDRLPAPPFLSPLHFSPSGSLISVGPFADVSAMEQTNVQGTKNIIDACKKAGVERLIYTSSLEVAIGTQSGFIVSCMHIFLSQLVWQIVSISFYYFYKTEI